MRLSHDNEECETAAKQTVKIDDDRFVRSVMTALVFIANPNAPNAIILNGR